MEKEVSSVCKLVKDPVTNVRMNVIWTLLMIYVQNKTQFMEDKIGKVVSYLEKDTDHYISTLVKKISSSNYNTAAQVFLSEEIWL